MSANAAARARGSVQGVAVMIATTFAMAFGDALVKSLNADFSVAQIFVLRSLVALPAIAALSWLGAGAIMPRSTAWAALRSGLLVLMWIAFYAALPALDLAVVAAAYYSGPLFITLLSALLLGDRVESRRWAAVAAGFAGVLVIVRPGSDAFTWFTLLPVASAVFYALAAIVTRARCRDENPLSLSLALNGAFLAVGLVGSLALPGWAPTPLPGDLKFLLGPWHDVDARGAGLIVLMAAIIVAVSTGVAKAYQSGPPSLIATFDYTYLVFAALWGFVFFADVPDLPTVLGMVLIGGAGLMAMREPGPIRPVEEPLT